MPFQFHPSKKLGHRRFFRFIGMVGLVILAVAGRARGITDYTYYSNDYAYDNMINAWYDLSQVDPNTGGWLLCPATPDNPGTITGGDNWSYSTVNGSAFAFDNVIAVWYFYYSDIDNWLPCHNPNYPTDYIYFDNYSTGDYYQYDNLGGFWNVDYSGNGDWGLLGGVPDDPGVLTGGDNWSYSTVNDSSYAYDSVINAWYVYYTDIDNWLPCNGPNNTTDCIYYYDSGTGNCYRYDNLSGYWCMQYLGGDGWGLLDGAPDDPGVLTGGDNWSYSTVNGSSYAYDSVIGAWYVYYTDIDNWLSCNNPNNTTDCIYYYDSGTGNRYRYDNLSGNWNVAYSGNGDWRLLGGAPDVPGVLTGGDNWSYSTVNGSSYAYDSVINAWYADNGYNGDVNGEIWSPCDDPTQSDGSGGGDSTMGSLTVGSLLIDLDAYVSGGFFVGNDFSIGGTAFDPTALSASYDGNGNFLGWQLVYYGLQNGADATFNSLNVTGGLTIPEFSGNVSVAGPVGLGTWNNGSQNFTGLTLDGNAFTAASNAALWHWQENGTAAPADQMTFDYSAKLNLFSSGNSTLHALSINPGSFALTSQNNSDTPQTYNLLTLSATSSTVVLNLADGFILDSSAPSLRLGNATITGSDAAGALVFTDANSASNITLSPSNQSLVFSDGFSIAGSSNSVRLISGGAAVALGGNATASGNNSVAMAGGAATGDLSVALGSNSSASGNGALALGANSVAAANGAVALAGGNATANQAIAIGPGTLAQTWGATVVGHYNAPITGNTTAFSITDPALIVGIGANSTARANGLVIYNNGDAVANGNITLAHPSYVSPTDTTQPVELQVNGATFMNGSASLNGKVIIVAPQGSLPMGAFGN